MTLILSGRVFTVGTALGIAAAPFATRRARAANRVVRFGFASIGAGNRQFTNGTPVATSHEEGDLEREFAKREVVIQWLFFAGAGPAVNEALANDQLDLVLQGDLPSVIGRSNGLRTRIRSGRRITIKGDRPF